jgi:hypothetical protein
MFLRGCAAAIRPAGRHYRVGLRTVAARSDTPCFGGDVEHQRRRIRDVEALDASGKIEPRHSVAHCERQLPQSFPSRRRRKLDSVMRGLLL